MARGKLCPHCNGPAELEEVVSFDPNNNYDIKGWIIRCEARCVAPSTGFSNPDYAWAAWDKRTGGAPPNKALEVKLQLAQAVIEKHEELAAAAKKTAEELSTANRIIRHEAEELERDLNAEIRALRLELELAQLQTSSPEKAGAW